MVGALAFNRVLPFFIPVLQSAFSIADGSGMNSEASPLLFALLVFFKNALVAVLCLLTARITFGVYPTIVVVFNGLLLGFTATALVLYGDMQLWQVIAGVAPHIGFELFGVFLACAIGLMSVPLKVKFRSSSLVWLLLVTAAILEATLSRAITSTFC